MTVSGGKLRETSQNHRVVETGRLSSPAPCSQLDLRGLCSGRGPAGF